MDKFSPYDLGNDLIEPGHFRELGVFLRALLGAQR